MLVRGVDEVDGGWILESEGPYLCLNELEQNDDYELIGAINAILDGKTQWAPLTPRDAETVRDVLETWGIAP